MRFDSDQRAAITATGNAVVSAGAGSGKTSVLTRRYLRLVTEERLRVGEILALTFTRKAAAEMYERIYRELLEQTDDAFVREQLADFDSAVISTLDSFCSGIARNGCARFGVPTTFVIDERSLQEMAEQLALAFLSEHSDDPVVADLIRLNSFTSLWKDGLASLAVNHFSVADDRELASYLPEQNRFLVGEHARLAASLRRVLEAIAALDPDGPKCVRDAQAVVDALDLDRTLPDPDEVEGDRSAAERVAGELAAIDRMHKRCAGSKHPDVPLYTGYLSEAKDLAARLVVATHTLARWNDAERLTGLLERFRERVVSEKRRLALLSYHDVTRLAIRTLAEDTALRSFYKNRFRAIMIDEFQDNNDEQKELLYLVAERPGVTSTGVPPAAALDPGKLFFVGDEKQSIYRFRGADVAVFRTLAAELARPSAVTDGTAEAPGAAPGASAPGVSGPETDLRLGANYRSEPGLIAFFNELFSRVFADAEHDYEARFEPLRSRDATAGVKPRVELWRLEQRESGDALHLDDTDAEAYHIASWIRTVVDGNALNVRADDGEVRPAGYADVAILMRSSSNQIRLERMLRLFGIPYVSQAARSLFLEAPVNDIYQVLQLVTYPNDRVAYAGYLRSPLVGLSDQGIVRQLLHEEHLLGEVAGHTPDDLGRLELARERYAELCVLADSRPITELLHTIWYEWGYRYHLLRREQYVPYLEYYDLFWELAHTFESEGLAAFVDEVRRHVGQNEKLDELEIIRGEAEGVHIMTIHKSKGLEFPVVIVANAGNRGRNDSVSAQPFYWSDTRGLAFNTGVLPPGSVREKAANYLYMHELEERKAQDRAELKRLLYVASTRAESHLVFSGVLRDDDRSLMGILSPAFDEARQALGDSDGLTVSVRDLEPVLVEEERQARRSEAHRDMGTLAAVYASTPVVDRAFPRVEWTATTLNAAARGAAAGAQGSSGARVAAPAASALAVDAVIEEHDLAALFGTYCHYCIEHGDGLPRSGAPDPSELPVSVRVPDRVPPRDRETFYRDGADLARGFLSSETAVRLADAQSVDHEVAFLLDARALDPALLAGLETAEGERPVPRIVRGQIDLLAEFDDRVLVVDFKTDRELDPGHYRTQMAVYRAAAAALSGKPVDVELFDLRRAGPVRVSF